MKVSCLISSYNPEYKNLSRCINSIKGQIDQLVIIDDCSTNEILERVLGEINKRNLEITFIKNKFNLGQTKSLIKGVKHCRHELIARVDDDDYWLPGKIKKQLEMFKKNNNLVVCGTSYEVIRTNKKIYKKHNIVKDVISENTFLRGNPFVHSSVVFKKSAYLKVGGYKRYFYYCQDFELWTNLFKIGNIEAVKDIYTVLTFNKRNSFKKILKLIKQFLFEIRVKKITY